MNSGKLSSNVMFLNTLLFRCVLIRANKRSNKVIAKTTATYTSVSKPFIAWLAKAGKLHNKSANVPSIFFDLLDNILYKRKNSFIPYCDRYLFSG